MTRLLQSGDIALAAEILRNGGTVGVPTETVYGLAANALDANAVRKIFEAKGRPSDNPLIIHISGAEELPEYCENIPGDAYKLAAAFWPGPLTMVLTGKKIIPDAVTAGLGTVAVRCPDCDITRRLIKECGAPLAAPSANSSGKPSPTAVRHVLDDLGGKIDAVIDGGPCAYGIESTILDMTVTPPRILRPGGVTAAQIRSVLGTEVDETPAAVTDGETPPAPGMKYRHYAPDTETVLLRGGSEAAAAYIKRAAVQYADIAVLCFDDESGLFPEIHTRSYGRGADWRELSKNLYSALRELDSLKMDIIYVRTPESDADNTALINRLMKAAGNSVIDLGNR